MEAAAESVGQTPRHANPERIARLLCAERVALVGASDSSAWSSMTYRNFETWGFRGEVHLVNRRGVPAHGRETFESCRSIPGGVELAILLVSNAAVPHALRDASAAGASGAIVLGAGFAEAGAAGQDAQEELARAAAELDITVFGPNAVGFVNLLDRVPAWVSPLPRRYVPGSVGVVSQSGNLALTIADFAAAHGVGLSHAISTGNEVNLDAVDAMACLVEDERVDVVAVFLEAIRDAQSFLRVAKKAAELQKPLVVLKTGTTSLAAQVAQTHTGAIVGDDDLVTAAFRQTGVIRVSSLEELVLTAGLLAHTGRLPRGGLGVVSISGGSNDIVADRAAAAGVPLPQLGPETESRLAPVVEQLRIATLLNPFDVTGAAIGNMELLVEPLAALASDPAIAIVAYTGVPFLESPPMIETYQYIARGLREAGRRGVLVSNTLQPVSAESEAVLREAGIPFVIGGIEEALVAIGNALRWSSWHRARQADNGMPTANSVSLRPPAGDMGGPEAQALQFFHDNGVPVVPWAVAGSAQEAVVVARSLGYPVVVKVLAPAIKHKTEIGGVALDLRSDDEVRTAFARVVEAAGEGGASAAAIVQPFRSGGTELLLGITNDADWGLNLALGLGGIAVEALGAPVVTRLPVTVADVVEMLDEAGITGLLSGVRGGPATDLEQLAATILRFTHLAIGVGPSLEAMEINPLRVDGMLVEALDGLVVWQSE